MADARISLEQAIYKALTEGDNGRRGDLSILCDPKRFYSCVADTAGTESRESVVLDLACSEGHYLSYYYQASNKGTSSALTEAAKKASVYLTNTYAIDPIVANGISNDMSSAIARYLGIGGFRPTEPYFQSSSVTTPKERQSSSATGNVEYRNAGLWAGPTIAGGSNTHADRMPPDSPGEGKARDKGKSKGGRHAAVIATASAITLLALAVMVLVGSRMGFISLGQILSTGEAGTVLNQTKAKLTFDANGADQGSAPNPLTCDMWTTVKLPKPSGLQREGYVFAGWAETKKNSQPYLAGGDYYVEHDATLYAIWNIVVELSNQFEVDSVAYATETDGYVAMVFVTNKSESTVDIQGNFSFVDAEGNVVDAGADSVWSVGPGDKTLITKETPNNDVVDASWTLVASVPVFGSESAMHYLQSSIVSVGSNCVEVQVQNTGDNPAWLMFCTLYGHDEQNRFAQQTNLVDYDEQQIDPGESIVLTYPGDYWQFLTNEVYLYGYANKYESL